MSTDPQYLSINELIEALQSGLLQLDEGEMSLIRLNELTEQSRELYERLVVIRHRAFEQFAREEEREQEAPSIRITVPENQINLIDVIEEEEGRKAAPEVGSLAFPEDEAEEEPATEEPAIEEEAEAEVMSEVEESVEELSIQKVEVKASPGKIEIEVEENSGSKSLADKLRHTPIADLKKAIGLNQKFQFITSLFKGDHQSYDKFIDVLNSAEDRNKAFSALESFRERREIDEEDSVYLQLRDLLERRYV